MVGLSWIRRWPLVCGALGVMGCGLDIGASSGGEAGEDTDTAATSPVSTGLESDTANPGTSGPGQDSEEGSTGSGEPSNETGDLIDPCELDCGVNGHCEFDDDGHQQCVCESGYASTGLACVACTTVMGSIDADVPIVDAVFEFRIAEVEPPAMIQESGRIFLRNTTSGDEVLLGTTYEGGATKTIIPGVYEIYYSRLQGGAAVPINRDALIETRYIDDAEPIVVNVPMVSLTGTFTIAGEVPVNSPYDFGRVYLVDPHSGDEALLGATRDGSFSVNVVPGEYEIHYRLGQSEGQAPINHDARIGNVTVDAGAEDAKQLEIDVAAVDVQGAITINGEMPPAVVQDYGHIVFVDRVTGDRIEAGATRHGEYAVRIVEGEYDVFYELVAGGIGVPVNHHALLQTTTIGGGAFDIDVGAVPLSGGFTVGGSAPPVDASDDGVLMLRNGTGDLAYLGNTHDVSFDALVVPGQYDVYYAQETAGAVMPGNTNAFVRQLTVQQGGGRTLDVPVAHVSGVLQVSGAVPPDSVYDDGRVYLRNNASGDSVLLGNTRIGQYAATVVPGTYDVVYEAELSDAVVPVNKAAVIVPDVEIQGGDVALDIDVPVAQVSGAIQVDNTTPPSGGTEHGNLYLEDLASEDLIWLGSTRVPTFATPLATGRYLLRYRGLEGGDALPANANAGITCYDVQ